jgi:hypothetical protein
MKYKKGSSKQESYDSEMWGWDDISRKCKSSVTADPSCPSCQVYVTLIVNARINRKSISL